MFLHKTKLAIKKQLVSYPRITTNQHAQTDQNLQFEIEKCRQSERHFINEKGELLNDYQTIAQENKELQLLLSESLQRNRQLESQVENLVQEKDKLQENLDIHKEHWHNIVNIDEVVTDAVRKIEIEAKHALKEVAQQTIQLESLVERLVSEKDKINEERKQIIGDLRMSEEQLIEEKHNLEEQLKIHKDHWHKTVNIDEVVTDAISNIDLKTKLKLKEATREQLELEAFVQQVFSERDEENGIMRILSSIL
mmetsp:Transcript_25711/g.37927  ORF Transcript_25711/g.37927 Transcript_25711/m.37927 type:complete len:252 (-) Transcript_25711:470-1225(-)